MHCEYFEVCVPQTYELKMECLTSDGEVLCTLDFTKLWSRHLFYSRRSEKVFSLLLKINRTFAKLSFVSFCFRYVVQGNKDQASA